jgi:hypothetical protein
MNDDYVNAYLPLHCDGVAVIALHFFILPTPCIKQERQNLFFALGTWQLDAPDQ